MGSLKVLGRVTQRPGNLEGAPAGRWLKSPCNPNFLLKPRTGTIESTLKWTGPLLCKWNVCIQYYNNLWSKVQTGKKWQKSSDHFQNDQVEGKVFKPFQFSWTSRSSSAASMCVVLFVPLVSPPEVFAVAGGDAWECWNLSHMFGSTSGCARLLICCFLGWAKFRGPAERSDLRGFLGRHRNGGPICCCIGGAQHAPLPALLAPG